MPDVVYTLPKVKRDIVAAVNAKLRADGYPTDTECLYGLPARDVPDEFIAVGGTDEEDEGWAGLGARKRDETYSLFFAVSVLSTGNSQQEATERVFTLLGVLATVLRDNPHIGNAGNSLVVEVKPRRLLEQATDEGHIAEVQGALHVLTARI